jgi:hypothetical protein
VSEYCAEKPLALAGQRQDERINEGIMGAGLETCPRQECLEIGILDSLPNK